MKLATPFACIPLLVLTPFASADAEFEVSVNNDSWDLLGSFFNDVRMINAATALGLSSGSRVDIIGVGWNITISTWDSGSWLSEASILFEDPDDFPVDFDAFTIAPGSGDNFAGQRNYNSNGIVLLGSQGLPPQVLDNGMLRLEFFETFDDFSAEVDAELTGTITLLTTANAGPCSDADLSEPFGTLDLSDITAFITAFMNQDPAADLAPPQGTFDLADIVEFISTFSAGCP